jgi:hypothetical protein
MGLFSSEYVYIVDTSTTRLVEKDLPDRNKQAVTSAIVNNNSIPDNILSNIQNGIYSKTKKYFNYGRDRYIFGLPEAKSTTLQPDNAEVQRLLELLLQEPVSLIDVTVPFVPSLDWVGAYQLQEQLGLDIATNTLYLEGDSDPWHYAYTELHRWIDLYDVPHMQVIVYITKTTPTGQTYLSADITEYYHSDPHYQVMYRVDSHPADIYIVLYRIADNTYPTLNNPVGDLTDFFAIPVVPIRYWFKPINEEFYWHWYATCKPLLKRIVLSMNELNNSIIENPDSEFAKHAFVVFGANIYTENQYTLRYLALFFSYLETNIPSSRIEYEAYIDEVQRIIDYNEGVDYYDRVPVPEPPIRVFQVQEQTYDTTLEFNFIETVTLTGVKCDVGDVVSEFNLLPAYVNNDGGAIIIQRSSMFLYWQHSPNSYNKMEIHGLCHVTTIKETDGSPAYVKRVLYDETLEISEANQKDNFIIPLSAAIIEYEHVFNIQAKESILYDSLHLVIYAEQKHELAWYQTSFFTGLIQIASIFGMAIGVGGTLQVAIEAGKTLGKTLISLLLKASISYIISYTVSSLIAKDNKELALLLTAAFMAFGLHKGGFFDALSKGLPTARDLLDALKAVTEIVAVDTEAKTYELETEIEEWTKEAEKIEEELQAAADMLPEVNSQLDPTYIMNRMLYEHFAESPEEFYNRTIHIGNPGVATLDIIQHYVGLMLRLPEANDRLIV